MLKPTAFANSIAALSVAFYLVMWLLGNVSPTLYNWVSSIYAKSQPSTATLVPTIISAAVLTWVFGYLWAWLYNKLAK